MDSEKPHLVWFKKDLRTHDHLPLVEAAARGPVIALYIYEDELILGDDFADRHLIFLNQCLAELDDALASIGGRLLRRRGDAVEVLETLRHELGFASIWSHEETGNMASFQRDCEVGDWCRYTGVTWHQVPQTGVVRCLKSRDGWSGKWAKRMNAQQYQAPQRLRAAELADWGHALKSDDFGLASESHRDLQKGGRKMGLELQDSFLHERGTHYRKEMSSPITAWNSCSRISPYFTFGCISIREAYQTAKGRRAELKAIKADGGKIEPGWMGSLQSYLGRLRWHCHFMQKLEDEPELEFQNFSPVYDGLREAHWSEERFQAWAAGQTGYPLIDAVMRCLEETGWINFRMRAMVMSFAAYHLWLHWRKPALHLARVFTDYEPGIHYSQAQMQSGVTGINTIRIYSPIKQVEDQDPDGEFIKKWVPELAELPVSLIGEPHSMTPLEEAMYGCRIGVDYPAPIVDHKTAYQFAKDQMFSIRKTAVARVDASRVQLKHGSRKQPTRQWR
ncbi:MAG: deoxyribodipyrimidine photo-lyase/cryptochrome family protein [Verrucomicrobiota bacterium]